MQRVYSWHSSSLLVGGLPLMCVFQTSDFSECVLSTSLLVPAFVRTCQNLFGHMCDCLLISVYVSVSVCNGKQRQSTTDRGRFLTIHLCCVILWVDGTSARWMTGCCSAFWQTVPLNHAAVVAHSDRTQLAPWDSPIGVFHALNEEVNMLNCLVKMKWKDSETVIRDVQVCSLEDSEQQGRRG